MSTIIEPHAAHDLAPAPHFENFVPETETPPHQPPFGAEFWYRGFFDDPFDPETDKMPLPPMAFRGEPIRLVGKPGQMFHERKATVFSSYDFKPFNPYRENIISRDDWALHEAEQVVA